MPPTPPPAIERASAMTSVGSSRRVLVVEDEFLVASTLEEMLDDLGFVVVGPVPRLAEALQVAWEADFDIALLDVNLAGQHVFPVAEALAKRGIPFVFMSGYGSQALPATFKDRPNIGKPFKSDRLSDALVAALGQHA